LIGDLPFFVSPDSSDVWAHPELFLLDGRRRPRFVAGVPPDYFSAQGQLWGFPVYDWETMRRTGYRWAIDRIQALLAHVDVIRLDHFRGFAAAWHVPAGARTAQSGEWVPAPGTDFFRKVRSQLGCLPFIAEDLGHITPDVSALLDGFAIAGTRVLQFAFDDNAVNPHLPHNCPVNSAVYTGTHDNATTREWYEDLPEPRRRAFLRYLKIGPRAGFDASRELIRLAWGCRAALAIAPLQDLLSLGQEGRMNLPGLAAGNWRWRVPRRMLSDSAFHWLADLTMASRRWPEGRFPVKAA
jgi:4-alpha-glucanotransferase